MQGDTVVIEVALAAGLPAGEHEAVRAAAAEIAEFLDRKLDLAITG